MEGPESVEIKGPFQISQETLDILKKCVGKEPTTCHMKVTTNDAGDIIKVACSGTCGTGICQLEWSKDLKDVYCTCK